jgi:hypothetical protein
MPTMDWDNGELTIAFLSGRKGVGCSDVDGIHFTCACQAKLDIPNDGPSDYSPGSRMDVTGGFLIECPHCGTTFEWNCNAPDSLYELSKEPEQGRGIP